MMANQVANIVAGDMAAGDINKHYYAAAQLTAMTRLIEEFIKEKHSDPKLQTWIATLEHYLSQSTEGDVRGLEEKLTAAGRESQLSAARRRKHDAAQLVVRHQSSPSAQKIFSYLLAKLLTSYENKVMPLIQEKASRQDIDAAIHEHVIEPAWSFLEKNPLEIDHRMLSGLLYFLGGNCHIRWDPC